MISSNPPVNVVRDINLTGGELQHLFYWPNVFLSHRYERDKLRGQTGLRRVMNWRHVQLYATWKTKHKSSPEYWRQSIRTQIKEGIWISGKCILNLSYARRSIALLEWNCSFQLKATVNNQTAKHKDRLALKSFLNSSSNFNPFHLHENSGVISSSLVLEL